MRAEGKESFPSQFGRYTLIERLATGGMAEVFKAKIVSTHGFEKPLVIKRILPHLAADKTFVAMFIDEAKVTAQLVHPKIVQVTDFGDVNGQFFIAMEFVDGFDALALLRTAAQRQVRLPVPVCMFMVIEVLDALDYAHNARDAEGRPMRIVHRDISPSNVFISRRGDVKLGDFGIAHAQERESKTQAGTLKGKYGYMSPEQVVGGSLDGRSDLFAVGIVLAEMLMGRRLFTAPNDLDVLLMVRDGRLDRLDKYCKDLPPDLDQVLRTSLKKKVTERFQTAAEFRDALSDLVFRMGFRIGPSDLGRLALDYFDPSPESLTRVKQHAERWRVRAVTGANPAFTGTHLPFSTGTYQAVTGGGGPAASAPSEVTPPPQALSAQKQEWGIPPTPPPILTGPPPRAAIDRPPGRSSPQGQPPARGRAPSASAPPLQGLEAHGRIGEPSPMTDLNVVIDEASGPVEASPVPPHPVRDTGVMQALDMALSQPLAIVDLDQYEAPSGAGLAADGIEPGGLASSAGGSGLRRAASASGGRAAFGGPPSPSQVMAGAPTPLPDHAGDLTVLSPMRVFADLAVAAETGMLRFENGQVIKDVYLVRGSPESVTSNQAADRFGQYLVSRGFLRAADLELAQAQLSRHAGKLGDALVSLGLMKPIDAFRLLAQHVRERVMDVFSWTQGQFAFFRNVRNPAEAFPLGLDSFEILGASVLTLSFEALQNRFALLSEFRPRCVPQPRIALEAFRMGSKPRELYQSLDGRRTVNDLMHRYSSAGDLLGFLRMLYLLLETDLVRLE